MYKMKRLIVTMLTVCLLLSWPSGGAAAQDLETQRRLAEALKLTGQAIKLSNEGRYDEASPLAEQVLAIVEKAFDPEDIVVTVALKLLADIYQAKGDYVRAEPLFKRALNIREKVLPAGHPQIAEALNDLASLYDDTGNYGEAEPLFKRALDIREKKLGPDHLDVTNLLNQFGVLYFHAGDYLQAEQLFRRALKIRQNKLNPEHPDIATSLSNLAALYQARGDYEQAEPLFKRGLAIREKALPGDHLDIASSLNNLAGLYLDKEDYEQAEPLFKSALEIREKKLGPEHPDVATILSNLALLYQAKGDFEQAERLSKRALEIREKRFGPEHLAVAMSLNNLSFLYYGKGENEKRDPLLKRALAIFESELGPNHPHIATMLSNLFVMYSTRGDYARAGQSLMRESEIQEHNLRLILTTGSENQKQLYLNTLSNNSDAVVSHHVHNAPRDDLAAQLALTNILRRKGRALDAMTDQIGALRRYATSENKKLFKQLQEARSHLATLQITGGGKLPPRERQAEVVKLAAEVERLEDEASRRSKEFRAREAPITLDAIRQAIPADAALVELFTYRPFNTRARSEAEKWGARRYVAYVLRRDEAVPQWGELGEAAQVDKAVTRLRQALGNPPLRKKGERVSDTELHQRMVNHESEVKESARALDEKVMQPVRKLLGPIRRIFLSPDGALNLIPFAALVDENGKYLIENYSLSYLTSGRDLLRLQAQPESHGAAVVMADPLYDTSAPELTDTQVGDSLIHSDESRRSVDFTLLNYRPLPGTAVEAAALAKLLPDARVLTQKRATEAALKQVSRPRVLHIATHGFFLPDQPRDSPAGNKLRRGTFDTFSTSPLPARWENPLLRSGLVLAGVKQGRSGSGEDGVLTALETAGLDLWGTKLVVLSACETGLGDVANGAGVYGLRRALVLAGSETQVMSLWKVSDAGTHNLMAAYYTSLQKGNGRTEALRQVQLEMLGGKLLPTASSGKRETGDTGVKNTPKDYRHPYYWAAFIQSGDWRNMDGK